MFFCLQIGEFYKISQSTLHFFFCIYATIYEADWNEADFHILCEIETVFNFPVLQFVQTFFTVILLEVSNINRFFNRLLGVLKRFFVISFINFSRNFKVLILFGIFWEFLQQLFRILPRKLIWQMPSGISMRTYLEIILWNISVHSLGTSLAIALVFGNSFGDSSKISCG